MTNPNPLAHIHVYERVKHPKRRDLYYCIDPHCTHRINAMYLPGKAARCPYCRNEYVINNEQIRRGRKVLHCNNCTKKGKNTKGIQLGEFEKLLESRTTVKGDGDKI